MHQTHVGFDVDIPYIIALTYCCISVDDVVWL